LLYHAWFSTESFPFAFLPNSFSMCQSLVPTTNRGVAYIHNTHLYIKKAKRAQGE
jgi:hypothetical protein